MHVRTHYAVHGMTCQSPGRPRSNKRGPSQTFYILPDIGKMSLNIATRAPRRGREAWSMSGWLSKRGNKPSKLKPVGRCVRAQKYGNIGPTLGIRPGSRPRIILAAALVVAVEVVCRVRTSTTIRPFDPEQSSNVESGRRPSWDRENVQTPKEK